MDDAVLGDRARECRSSESDRLGSDQCAFGVEPVQDAVEALAVLADSVLRRHRQLVRHRRRERRLPTLSDDRRDRLQGVAAR